MQLQGTVTRIDQLTERPYGNEGKVFRSRKFRIKTADQYPQTFELEVSERKLAILDNLRQGDEVTASINLKGREWEKDGKGGVYMTIDCWAISKTGIAPQAAPGWVGGEGAGAKQPSSNHTYYNPSPENVDDLPF